jgi:hypothetical protein
MARRLRGPGDDYPFSIVVDADGRAYVGGVFDGTASVQPTGDLVGAGGWDGFVVALSPEGVPVWSQSVGGTSHDLVRGLALDTSRSRLYALGRFANSAAFGAGTTLVADGDDRPDVFFASLDVTSGDWQWARRISSAGESDWGSGLDVDRESGHVTVAGYFSGDTRRPHEARAVSLATRRYERERFGVAVR